MVACSLGAAAALLAGTLVRLEAERGLEDRESTVAAARVGSLLGVGVAPAGWFGFHMELLRSFPYE